MGRPYKIKRHKRIYRRSAGNIILRVLIIVAAVAALFGIGWMLYTPVSDWISQRQNPDAAVIGESSAQSDGLDVDETTSDQSGVSEETETEDQQQAVLSQAQTAYLPIETVADEQQFAQALELAKEQGYDSILFDLKSSDGTVNYPISYNPSTDALVTGTTTVDLNAVVQQIRDAGLVPMASIYTFRDHRYPSANNAAATQYMDSDFLWVDNDPEKGGKAWLNPFSQQAQDYIRKIVDDACAARFEQIVLQGIQFPEGYSLDMIDYGEHASDDKHAFLQQYLQEMTTYAEGKGVELTALFPATSVLGGETKMYFGDVSTIIGDSAVLDLRLEVFGNGIQTDLLSIPDPSADIYNTVKTASAAVNQQLSGKELTVMVDGSGLSEDEVASLIQGASESGIERCIVFEPSLAQ